MRLQNSDPQITVRNVDPAYSYTTSFSAAVSPNGQLIATGSVDGFVHVWSVKHGNIIAEYKKHSGAVTSVKFTPDHAKVVSGGADGAVKFWNVRDVAGIASGGPLFLSDNEQLMSLEGHMVSVSNILTKITS